MPNTQLEDTRENTCVYSPQVNAEDTTEPTQETGIARQEDPMAVIQVGLDDGYAYTKLALADGRLIAIPSRGRIGQAGVTWMDAAQQQIFEYDTEGSRYAVGQIDGESTCYDGYPMSGLHRAIVQHAFQEAKLAGRSVHVVSGLPVSAFYFKDGQKREQAIAHKRDSLKIPVQPVSSDGCYATQRLPVAVGFHEVIPEALAAWYDQVIRQRAGGIVLDARLLEATVAIVDIGGRTTDYVVVQKQGIVHRSSGSLTRGLLDAQAQVAREIQKRFDLESWVTKLWLPRLPLAACVCTAESTMSPPWLKRPSTSWWCRSMPKPGDSWAWARSSIPWCSWAVAAQPWPSSWTIGSRTSGLPNTRPLPMPAAC
jgi:plasmid segregation protein ParM